MGHDSPTGRPIRIAIADDDPAVLDYVRLALDCEGDFEVVGVAADAGTAIDVVADTGPDVLLLDLEMPGGGGLTAAQLVGSLTPGTKVLVFTADVEGAVLFDLLRAGISGYLLKSSSSDELVDAVRSIVTGSGAYAPNIARRAVDELTARLHTEHNREVALERTRHRVEHAMRDRAFTIVCQPIVDLATGAPHAVETLTRFDGSPPRPPDAWFADAASVSRGIDLELATASAALELLDSLDRRLRLSINLSPATVLSGGLACLFAGVDTTRVIIELTEHVAVEDYEFLNITLRGWRDRGVLLAIDDAGAGYASFAHILRSQPDYIKLDVSLTRAIDCDTARQALTRAIVGFARDLDISVIAEGIETVAELETMVGLGVHYGQGYRVGRPKPLDEQPELTGAALDHVPEG